MRKNDARTGIKPTFNDRPWPWPQGAIRRVLVLMSGGVDSSAAALLLLRRGWSVAGLTMNQFGDDSPAERSAAEVCRALSIPHFSTNIEGEFHSRVVAPFCRAYLEGVTPNPCADCNERVKLGLLPQIAEREWGGGFYLATGHYARIVERGSRVYLARVTNEKKDQSYFLSGIPREMVERMIFPLDSIPSKDGTRALVREAGLPVAERPESMEICFADEKDYRAVIDAPQTPGSITDEAGREIGRHNGIAGYTLGQRKGLGIASPYPLFVIGIRPRDNTIVAAPRDAAFSDTVRAEHVNFLAPELMDGELFGMIRSQGAAAPCKVAGRNDESLVVRFMEPVFAPAPGQRLVIYTRDGIVVAGGVIVS